MSGKSSCGCSCGKSKNKSQSNMTSSVEEGCNKNSVQNPKTATNNQW